MLFVPVNWPQKRDESQPAPVNKKKQVPLNSGPAQASLMQVNVWEGVISARPSWLASAAVMNGL
jgi:hypothetical protein